MSDRDKFHLSASIAVEIIALGVQMILAPSWGWVLIAGGGAYLFYALYRLFRVDCTPMIGQIGLGGSGGVPHYSPD